MKEILLTQGQVAVVDDEDYEWLMQWKWCAHFNPCTQSYYAMRALRRVNGRQPHITMHRQILGLRYGDRRQGDHINHNTLDNRRSNLRIVTATENKQNQRDPKGYSYDAKTGIYHARIRHDKALTYLGGYRNAVNAHLAYLRAKRIYHPTAPIGDGVC